MARFLDGLSIVRRPKAFCHMHLREGCCYYPSTMHTLALFFLRLPWGLYLFVNNLFNYRPLTTQADFITAIPSTYCAPTSVGLQYRMEF